MPFGHRVRWVRAAGKERGLPEQTYWFAARRIWHAALDLMFPEPNSRCLLCHRPVPAGMRPAGLDPPGTLERLCFFCLQEASGHLSRKRLLKLRISAGSGGGHVVPVIAAARYEGLIQQAIREWKYDGVVELTGWFADTVLDALRTAPLDAWLVDRAEQRGREPRTVGPHAIVPVPAAPDRFLARGYHHTLMLARALRSRWYPRRPPVRQWVLRHGGAAYGGRTTSQTAKGAFARREGLAGQFYVPPGVLVAGTTVLLVDDVMTTGATAAACAAALYQAGAARVVCTVIAAVD